MDHNHSTIDSRLTATRCSFPPLAEETRVAVPTGCAAWHLGRAAQTLRRWACNGAGLIQPIRVGNRLAWPVAEIRRLLGQ